MSFLFEPKNFNVLIVDDEPDMHSVLGRMLVKANYNVDSAYSAEEAFHKIESKKPDLIILDIMMPKVSGIEMCKDLRENPRTKDILILIISARDTQRDRLEGLVQGADDYVSKPFHVRSLLRKIEHMLVKRMEVQEY